MSRAEISKWLDRRMLAVAVLITTGEALNLITRIKEVIR